MTFLADAKLIKMFVLDEADEMLSRGFKDQIYEIFQKLSTNIQVRVFGTGTAPLNWLPSTLTEVCYNCVIQMFLFDAMMLAEYWVEGDCCALH